MAPPRGVAQKSVESNRPAAGSFSRVSIAEEDDEEEEAPKNELLVDLEGKDNRRNRETSMWFSKVNYSSSDTPAATGYVFLPDYTAAERAKKSPGF